MKLLTQMGETCMLYSVAMLLDLSVETVIKELGHDGSEILWPANDVHKEQAAAYHIQEIQDLCISRGFALAPIEVWPIHGPCIEEFKEVFEARGDDLTLERFFNHIEGRKALLFLQCNDDPTVGEEMEVRVHACAWDGENIYDPNGSVYPPMDLPDVYKDDWNIKDAWLLVKLI